MRHRFAVKKFRDGEAMLNLGCGTRMHHSWNNLDFSPYAYFARHKTLATLLCKLKIISKSRWKNILRTDPEIISWNLFKGIPFDNEIFDVVYTSHILEHFDKDMGSYLLKESYRVLKYGGIARIVIPDLYDIIQRYINAVQRLDAGNEAAFNDYEEALEDLFGQMVRKEPVGSSKQPKLIKFAEHVLRGGITKRGELHKWMYDQYSLTRLLKKAGYRDVFVKRYDTSEITNWNSFLLDIYEDGTPYKPRSIYIESTK